MCKVKQKGCLFTQTSQNRLEIVSLVGAGQIQSDTMMTSSNGNMFRVTGLLCGEFTGRIPHTKASDAELWSFLWSAPE